MAGINCADVAARIHADMCNDDRNGYSWVPRYGGDHPDGVKTLVIDGRTYSYPLGSWDCSSSVIKSWQEAIKYTPYKGRLDGAVSTHNMRPVFEGSGLFYSSTLNAKRGDIYLNDAHHTAMCQDGGSDGVYGYDAMSQFSINELGTTTGGQVGDQTGREAYVGAYRNYSRGWPSKLKYNGKADGAGATPSAPAVPDPAAAPLSVDGQWGCRTTAALQRALGTVEDGYIDAQSRRDFDRCNRGGLLTETFRFNGSGGSPCIRALQARVGAVVDGEIGSETVSKLQAYLGTEVDGYVDAVSPMVKALQRRLNEGNL